MPSSHPDLHLFAYCHIKHPFGLDIKREALPIPLVKVVGEALDVEKADPILAGGSKLIDVKHGLRAGFLFSLSCPGIPFFPFTVQCFHSTRNLPGTRNRKVISGMWNVIGDGWWL